jgi:predicted dehydrogenase
MPDNISRRGVIIGAAAAAQAAVKLPEKVRLAIIGFQGHPDEIIRPLPDLPDIEVVGIQDTDPAVLEAQARKPGLAGARKYSDYRRMLEELKPGLVAVCNPNVPRAAAIIAALERRIPVIAEKPIAMTRAELAKIETYVKGGAKVGSLFPMRFDGPYRALREAVKSGQLGDIVNVSAQKSYKWKNQAEWKRMRATYGDTISWIGIHMIDLIRFTTGREFTEVFSWQAQVSPQSDLGEMENTTGSVFRMGNGAVATLHMDYCRPETADTHGDDRLRIAGTKGVAEYLAATGVTLITDERKFEKVSAMPKDGSVFVDFVEHVFSGKPAGLGWTDVYRSTLATIAARESAQSGRSVKV